MKDCFKYISNLCDYLDGELGPELCKQIETHLGECPDCKVMLDTLRQTVKICREDGRCEELPEELSRRINVRLRERWQQKFGKK